MRRCLLGGGVFVALSSIVTLAIASRRIASEEAAFQAPSAGRCEAEQLNRSALLPGTSVAVSPLPGSYDATPTTQISLLGARPSAFSHLRVVGSQTGTHPGRLIGYSQGDGASFVPSGPFLEGERVSVAGRVKLGSANRAFSYRFVVSYQDPEPSVYSPTSTPGATPPQHFHSRPDLQPPALVVNATSPATSGPDVFATPYMGAGPSGPMIFDEGGNLVWFDPLPADYAAANLQVQREASKPVLTWWQGRITIQGFGLGEEMIYDTSYRPLGRVRAGNGLKADLHDFHITPQGTALLTAFNPIACNLSALGGPAGGAATDTIMQEIDLRTGLVRREWHSLDHIALEESCSTATHASPKWPYDYFHLNSFEELAGGTTLISARNTWALYELSTQTGQVLTRIGGRHSDLTLGPGTETAFQHDAAALPDGTISVFDNGAVPKVHPQSRGVLLSIDPTRRTETVRAQYIHPGSLSAGSQGNLQSLASGDMFIGWGSEPYFTEFSPSGTVLYDAHMSGSYQSYRAYRFAWAATPAHPPTVAVEAGQASAPATVYASWNGDTRTASWRLLAGHSPRRLAPVAAAPKSGFETTLTTPRPAAYVAVQALDTAGAVLGTSRVLKR